MRIWRAAILLVLASERWASASNNDNEHATAALYPLRRRMLASSTDSAVILEEKYSSVSANRALSDAFLDGSTVTGTYKYEYKVSAQQVLTSAPAASAAPAAPAVTIAATPAPTEAPFSPVAVQAPQQPVAPTVSAPTPLAASAPPVVAPAPISSSANPAAVTVPSSPAPTALLQQTPVSPTAPTAPSAPVAASANPVAITVPTSTAPAPVAASANPAAGTVPTPTVPVPSPTVPVPAPVSSAIPDIGTAVPTLTTATAPTTPSAPVAGPAPLVPALPTEPSPPVLSPSYVTSLPTLTSHSPAAYGGSKAAKSKKGSKSKAPFAPKTQPPVTPKTVPPVAPKTAPPVAVPPPTSPKTPPPVAVPPPTSPKTPPPVAVAPPTSPKTPPPAAVPPPTSPKTPPPVAPTSPKTPPPVAPPKTMLPVASPTGSSGKGGGSSSKSAKAPPPPKDGPPPSKGEGSGSGSGPPSKSSKDADGGSSSKGPPPKDAKDGPMELEEYEFEGSLPRTLPVAAFLYITSNQDKPNKYEYEQVAFQTQYLLDTVYRNAYVDQKSVEFMGVEISKFDVLASRLIKFDINVHFYQDRQIPSLWEVESIADAALGSSGSYLTLYLDLMGELDAAPVFATTTDVLFISNAEDLVRTQESAEEQDGNMYGGANLVAIVTSLVVSCVLIAGAVFYYYNYHRVNRRTRIFEEENAIEVKRESVNGDQTSRESQDDENDGDSSYADSSSYEEVEVVEESDYDEITLEDEEAVDYKKHVGEIKKSYVGTNIAEIKVRKQDPSKEGSSSGASPTPIRAYPVDSHSLLNPLGHPYSSSGSVVPILSATAVQVVPSPRPSSPPPVWSNPNLRPVQPKEEQRKDIRAMAKRADNDGDNRSLLSIDSQSSATPEFLKKFKQMGLAANPRPPIQVPLNPPPPVVRKAQDGDERSIVTIDSQSSTTPEFLKKFKQMGLQRYKA